MCGVVDDIQFKILFIDVLTEREQDHNEPQLEKETALLSSATLQPPLMRRCTANKDIGINPL